MDFIFNNIPTAADTTSAETLKEPAQIKPATGGLLLRSVRPSAWGVRGSAAQCVIHRELSAGPSHPARSSAMLRGSHATAGGLGQLLHLSKPQGL